MILPGLFMALQPKIIACGNSVAGFAMAVRFLTGPAVMAAASIAVGLRGTLLHLAIVQVNTLFLIRIFYLLHLSLLLGYVCRSLFFFHNMEYMSTSIRLHFLKESFPLSLPKSTMFIQPFLALGKSLSQTQILLFELRLAH